MSEEETEPTKHSPAPKPGDYMRYDEFILLPICTDDPESVLISGMKGGRRKPREEVTPLDAVDHLVEQYYLLMQKCASAYLHGAGWEDAGLIPCRRTAYVEAEDKAEEKLGEIRRVIEQYPTSFFQPGESVNTSDFELPNPFDLDCQNFADWKKEAKRVRFANTRRRLNIAENIERTRSSGKNAAIQPTPDDRLWLLKRTFAEMIYGDSKAGQTRTWNHKAFKGIPRRKSARDKQAYCYDAIEFLDRLREKRYGVDDENYDTLWDKMMARKGKNESDPCEGPIF